METHTLRYSRLCSIFREARRKRGLTQIEFSRRLGKPFNFVSKYENGERRLDVLEFNSIARALGIDAARTLRKIYPMPGTNRRPTRKKAASVDTPLAKKQGSKLKAEGNTVWFSCCVYAFTTRRNLRTPV